MKGKITFYKELCLLTYRNKRRQTRKYLICCLLLVIPGLIKVAIAEDQQAELRKQALTVFTSLRADTIAPQGSSLAQISLGRVLFFDKRISASGKISCAICHQPEFYGSMDTSLDAGNPAPSRNVQTVLNASLNFANNWYGDQTSVENQALTSLVSESGLGHASQASAIAKIKAIPTYRKLFSAAFPNNPDPVTPQNWAVAIGAFERTLITPSPFDDYLAGDDQAISVEAKIGLSRFMGIGCIACHNGVGIGGGSYQKFGIWEDYWRVTSSGQIDKGRFNLTHDENDLYVFRVADLRNVKMTPPYFHDGSVQTLPQAVRIMGRIQLRKTLSDEDVKYIVAFLGTLTGKLPDIFSPP